MTLCTNFTNDQAIHAKEVFLNPQPFYSWDEIINGTTVTFNGKSKTMWAVDKSTIRGFKKKGEDCGGPLMVYRDHFVENKYSILDQLAIAQNEDDLHKVENEICSEVKLKLSRVVIKERLESFNRIRKLVDLYIEHLVAMSCELAKYRKMLVPLLFLPLDSETLQKLFTKRERSEHNLKERATFGDVTHKDTYESLQRIAQSKATVEAERLGVPFYRIYFDMLWNQRLDSRGRNLFESNYG